MRLGRTRTHLSLVQDTDNVRDGEEEEEEEEEGGGNRRRRKDGEKD